MDCIKPVSRAFLPIFVPFLFLAGSAPGQQKWGVPAITLKPGPFLFIDDYLIGEQSSIQRTVNNPFKLPQPIVSGRAGGDSCFQPYVTVLRDPSSGLFRLWYGIPQSASQTHIGYMESRDGKKWIRPHLVLKDPFHMNFGISVVDRGALFAPVSQRFVFASYNDDGMMVATSADGLEWKAVSPAPVLKHNHDINSLRWDPIRSRWLAIVSCMIRDEQWTGERRIPHQSVSNDLVHWTEPRPILYPKVGVPREEGETKFYSMSGVLARGELLIGLVKILRDDCNATEGKDAKAMGDSTRKATGMGYTVLAWSRDGETWQRDSEPFIPNNPLPGSWDHAMAWGDDQLIVGDTTYVYYGGYARGHKVARFDERQIGLAILPRDCYVSRDADRNEGVLVTKPLYLEGSTLTINATIRGRMSIRLLDLNGNPLKGFGPVTLRGDCIDHPVVWEHALSQLRGVPVRIEVKMVQAQLFGFDLIS